MINDVYDKRESRDLYYQQQIRSYKACSGDKKLPVPAIDKPPGEDILVCCHAFLQIMGIGKKSTAHFYELIGQMRYKYMD